MVYYTLGPATYRPHAHYKALAWYVMKGMISTYGYVSRDMALNYLRLLPNDGRADFATWILGHFVRHNRLIINKTPE